MKKEKLLVSIFLAITLIGVLTFVLAENESVGTANRGENSVVCTMDAKMCPDGSYVSRNSSNDCKFNACHEENIKYNGTEPPRLGSSCGTVTPGYQDECCVNKGYTGWDAENFTCIGETPKEREGDVVGAPRMLGAFREGTKNETEGCEDWNCTRWSACINGNQTRQCVKIADCNTSEEGTPRLSKGCFEKERIIQHNDSFECPEECNCTGSVIKCELATGRIMTIYAGNSGNVIVQIKGINSSTNVTLYKADGKVYGIFKNNETKEIHLPDEVREKLENQTRTRLYNESINLSDDGYYHIEGQKKARLFWLVPVREHMTAQIDAQTGKTVKMRNPWWGFLARDVREKGNSTIEE